MKNVEAIYANKFRALMWKANTDICSSISHKMFAGLGERVVFHFCAHYVYNLFNLCLQRENNGNKV
jgi:hypothetical protein